MLNMLLCCLVCCLSWLHSSHVVFPPWKTLFLYARKWLDRSLIPLNTSFFYRGFLGFSRYLSTHSPINRAKFLNSLSSRYLLNTYLNTSKFLADDTSWYVELLFSTALRYLLDLCSCVSINARGPTRFCSNSNISTLVSSFSIQNLISL